MKIKDFIRMQYRSQFVLTTKQIADAYGCDISNIRHNFNQNKEQFIEGVHYFFLQGAELKKFKSYFADLQAAYNGYIKTHALDLPYGVKPVSLDVAGVVLTCHVFPKLPLPIKRARLHGLFDF